MKLTLIAFLSLTSISSFAQRYEVIDCQVAKPCQYSAPKDLGYCLGAVNIRLNDGSDGNHMVVSKKNNDGFEILRIAADIPLAKKAAKIQGATDDRESWTDLTISQGKATGTLVLEQDFAFQISCK
jgi:hypothetical protein